MKYDPIKRSLGKVFNKTPWLRKLFYRLLDLLLLRAWYVKRELRKMAGDLKGRQGVRVLDAGSGFGQYTWFLYRLDPSWQIDAVDVKEEQIADCSAFFATFDKEGRVHFSTGDLTKLEAEDRYDLILCVDVMEHIEEDERVFVNFRRALKPGGRLLVSTPSDQGGSDVHEHDEESFIDEHVRDGYNIGEIQEKLRKAGFAETEAYYSYGKPGQMAWRLSMKIPILMLNVSKIFFIVLPFYYLITYPFALLLNLLDMRGRHRSGTGLVVKGKRMRD
jgi:SAM-dependent methyltransferase